MFGTREFNTAPRSQIGKLLSASPPKSKPTEFKATTHTPTTDGVRVTAQPRPKINIFAKMKKQDEVPTTEEFHSGAFQPDGVKLDAPTRKRPKTRAQHRELLIKELETSNARISSLEQELENEELSSAEKVVKLNNIIDHQERAIQFRQMHLDTALDEKDELENKLRDTETRVMNVRNKALTRKFQSRFWLTMFAISLVENFRTGTVMWTATNVIMPITTDLVFSNSKVAVGLRIVLTMFLALYFKAYKQLTKVPSLF